MSIRIREVSASDETFLWRMLECAASDGDDERAADDLRADPALGRYLDGWGRPGDVGVVAVDGDDSKVGAAWVRLFSADRPGYGYIDEVTPELTIACLASSRGVDRPGGAGSVTSRYRYLLCPLAAHPSRVSRGIPHGWSSVDEPGGLWQDRKCP